MKQTFDTEIIGIVRFDALTSEIRGGKWATVEFAVSPVSVLLDESMLTRTLTKIL